MTAVLALIGLLVAIVFGYWLFYFVFDNTIGRASDALFNRLTHKPTADLNRFKQGTKPTPPT